MNCINQLNAISLGGVLLQIIFHQIWVSDLVELQPLSKFNKGFKYLLIVVDVFSKYGWIRPLKDKKVKP